MPEAIRILHYESPRASWLTQTLGNSLITSEPYRVGENTITEVLRIQQTIDTSLIHPQVFLAAPAMKSTLEYLVRTIEAGEPFDPVMVRAARALINITTPREKSDDA